MHNEDRTSEDKENGVLIIAYSKRSEIPGATRFSE